MPFGQLDAVSRHLRKLAGTLAARELTDADLLGRYVSDRDEAAFAAIVERHGGLVWSVCRRLLSRTEDVEDAFQATFLVLIRKATTIRQRGAIASWLYGVAYRTAMKAKKSSASRRERQSPTLVREPEQPISVAALRELQTLLDQEVERLPEKYRAPFVLCCLEGKSRAEAARDLGWKEGTIAGRVAGARERLQHRLARRGVALTSALCAGALAGPEASGAVPAALSVATMRAAAGDCKGAVSAEAVRLAKSVLQGMVVSKAKAGAALALALGILAGGVTARQAPVEKLPPEDGQKVAEEDKKQPIAARDMQVHTDRHGDPLPGGASARLGSVRLQLGSRAWSVAFSPDGKTIASCSNDIEPLVRLWDASTGEDRHGILVGSEPWPGTGMTALAYSPDGKLLAGGCYGLNATVLMDAEGAQVLKTYGRAGSGINCVAFSPDGKTLAWGGYDKTVCLGEVGSGKVVRTFTEPKGSVYGVCFTPDGGTLVGAGDDKAIRFWDMTSGKMVRQLEGHQESVRCVLVMHDGKRLGSGDAEGIARIWDLASGKELHCCRGHAKTISSLLFTPDDKLLITGSRDQTIRFWDTATGSETRCLRADGMDISGIALSPDGRKLAVSGFEQGVCIFDVASGEELLPRAGHRGWVLGTHFSPDGKTMATGSTDGTLRLWDPSTGVEKRMLTRDKSGWFIDFAYSPDGRAMAASNYGDEVCILDLATGKVLRRLAEPDGYISNVRFLADGNTVATFSFTSGTGRRSPTRHSLTLWDTTTGKKLWTAPGRPDAFAFSPDGKTAAVCVNGEAPVLYDVRTGKEIKRLPVAGWFESIAFTPDGKGLVLADPHQGSLMFWDFARSRALHRQSYDKGGALSHANTLTVSPDGRLAATIIDGEHLGGPGNSGGGFKLWEVATLQEVASCRGHRGSINNLEFAPDGKTLASSSSDSTVLIWDVLRIISGERNARAHLEPAQVEALCKDLASEAAVRAYRAVGVLARAPQQTIPYLRSRLRPVQAPVESDVARWLGDLDDSRYAVRQHATAELEKSGSSVEGVLRQALTKEPSLEFRHRIEHLLERIEADNNALSRRILAVLEYANTDESRRCLQTLTTGAPQALLTIEAKAALERLNKR
jgi:RNA polymerase sigma factor (sigma-70 family)